MRFGMDKCAKCTMKKGRNVEASNITLDDGEELKELDSSATYKYLVVEENENIEHQRMRENVKEEYQRRVKKICNTELTPRNKIIAINCNNR